MLTIETKSRLYLQNSITNTTIHINSCPRTIMQYVKKQRMRNLVRKMLSYLNKLLRETNIKSDFG
jgi:hypothetical protein